MKANMINTFVVAGVLPSTTPATAANYGVVFVAPAPCRILQVQEAHEVAGNDVGAVSLDVEKLTGTQAKGGGVSVLGTTKIDLKGTANTVQTPDLTPTAANRVLAKGDRLSLTDSGTLTTLEGVAVSVLLRWE